MLCIYRLILRIQHLIIDQISVGKELSLTARVREFVIPQINGAPPLHGNTCFMQLVVYNFVVFYSPLHTVEQVYFDSIVIAHKRYILFNFVSFIQHKTPDTKNEI